MDIRRENQDDLNAVVTIDIDKEDYQPKVDKILKDYRKTANIPGFRKGHVPMGLIKKQYGQTVLVDEVNKLLQENLNNYLKEQELDVLGNPLPKEKKDFSWEEDQLSFDFELGLAPDFEVNLNTEDPIPHYKIVADKDMIDNQVKNIREQYGKLKSKNEVEEGDQVTGVFHNEEEEIDNDTTFALEKIKGKENRDKFIGAKTPDVLNLNTKNLFAEETELTRNLDITSQKAEDLDVRVSFEIREVNEREPAELNEELFEKTFGDDSIKTEEEFRNRLKEEAEKQFEQQSDQQLLNDVTETLIDNTNFDLPDAFLQKWLKLSGEEEMSDEEAKEEYERSKKGLRFQLIENKIMKANDIDVKFEDVKAKAESQIKMQMAQFGQMDLPEEQVNSIVQNVLSNEQEARRFSDQVKNEKLLDFYKEHANLEEKEVTHDEFSKEAFEQNKE